MPILTSDNLHIQYRTTHRVAIEHISFSVKRGERVAILGPSGCGKTTFLKAIAGAFDKGQVEQSGGISLGCKRNEIAFVFQTPTLLPWRSVYGNIVFGMEARRTPPAIRRERALALLATIGLAEFEDYYPIQLSLGMQQRVNFARAISCEPALMLLDEPFSALDLETKSSLREEFVRIIKEKHITSIFVTHDIEEASLIADRIVVLSAGPATVRYITKSANDTRFMEYAKQVFDDYEG